MLEHFWTKFAGRVDSRKENFKLSQLEILRVTGQVGSSVG